MAFPSLGHDRVSYQSRASARARARCVRVRRSLCLRKKNQTVDFFSRNSRREKTTEGKKKSYDTSSSYDTSCCCPPSPLSFLSGALVRPSPLRVDRLYCGKPTRTAGDSDVVKRRRHAVFGFGLRTHGGGEKLGRCTVHPRDKFARTARSRRQT